jgi:hypothetical protein
MSTYRTVTGTFLKPDGTPLYRRKVKFDLQPGSYTPEDSFAPHVVSATIDVNGDFTVDLWANGEGDFASVYKCTMPGNEKFYFVLPEAGGDLTFSEVRALAQTPTPQQATVLAYLAARFGISIVDEGADPTGALDSGAALTAAAAKVQAGDSSLLYIPPGRYTFYSPGEVYTDLAAFEDLDAVGIVFAPGAVFEIHEDRVFTTSYGNYFTFTNCDNIVFENPRCFGPSTIDQTGVVKGILFAQFFEGCDGIMMPFGRFEGVIAPMLFNNQTPPYPAANKCKNINVGTLLVKNSWYGIAGTHSGDNVRIDQLICDSVFRAYIVYGVDDWVIGLVKETNHKGGAAIQSIAGDGVTNFYANHATRDSTDAEDHPHVQMSWDVTPGFFKNIHLNFDAVLPVAGVGESNGGPLLTILKFDGASAFDVVDRGHELDGLVIGCNVDGDATLPDNPLIGTHNECDWGQSGTPDVWRNLVLRNWSLKGGARYCRFNIGAMADQLITLDNVESESDVEFVVSKASQQTGNARIGVQPNCKFPNLYKFIGGAYPVANRVFVGASVSVPAGAMYGDGAITDEYAGAAQTLALPAAVPGMGRPFVRVTASDFKLDPNGTDEFRGRGAGKFLNMDTIGDSVTIRCFVAGTWDIVASSGTLAFEP